MSSSFQPKSKELAKVHVVTTDHYNHNRAKLKLIGTVSRVSSNFVTTKRNSKTGKCTFIDDTSSLTKKTKGQIVRFFSDKSNKRKEVAYLVVPKTANNSRKK